jgi:hypothetical protein
MNDDLTWQRRAACRLDPSLMWQDDRVLEAKQLCSVCPVLSECAEWEANLAEFVPGVIAGRDERERAETRRTCARCRRRKPIARGSSYCRACKTEINREAWEQAKAERPMVQCRMCHDWFRAGHGNARFCCAAHKTEFHATRQRQSRRSRAMVG